MTGREHSFAFFSKFRFIFNKKMLNFKLWFADCCCLKQKEPFKINHKNEPKPWIWLFTEIAKQLEITPNILKFSAFKNLCFNWRLDYDVTSKHERSTVNQLFNLWHKHFSLYQLCSAGMFSLYSLQLHVFGLLHFATNQVEYKILLISVSTFKAHFFNRSKSWSPDYHWVKYDRRNYVKRSIKMNEIRDI